MDELEYLPPLFVRWLKEKNIYREFCLAYNKARWSSLCDPTKQNYVTSDFWCLAPYSNLQQGIKHVCLKHDNAPLNIISYCLCFTEVNKLQLFQKQFGVSVVHHAWYKFLNQFCGNGGFFKTNYT